MNKEFLLPLMVGLSMAAIAASGKAIIDVQVLKNDKQYIRLYLEKIDARLNRIEQTLIGE